MNSIGGMLPTHTPQSCTRPQCVPPPRPRAVFHTEGGWGELYLQSKVSQKYQHSGMPLGVINMLGTMVFVLSLDNNICVIME